MQRFQRWKSNRAAAKEEAARAAAQPESDEEGSYDEEEYSEYSHYEESVAPSERSHASAKPAPNPVGDAAAATAGWLNSAWGATTAAISQARNIPKQPCTPLLRLRGARQLQSCCAARRRRLLHACRAVACAPAASRAAHLELVCNAQNPREQRN